MMKEKNPSVIIFKGNVMMLKIGLTKMNKTDKTTPARIYSTKPPFTLIPVKIWAVIKSATE